MRSPQDWEALRWAEIRGREAPGTFERLWREEQELIAAEKRKLAEAELAKARRLHDEMMKVTAPVRRLFK